MLELQDVSFTIRKNDEDVNLLDHVSLKIPDGTFLAIVGPSGCGKTSLLKTIAGLNPESSGKLLWQGRSLSEEQDFDPVEVGYVPQFSVAYDSLTVDESVEAVTRLRVKCNSNAELDARIDRVLEETGLSKISDRFVKILSGGQKRRLGLAMELVSDPRLLLCDEVTSGLDPRSEREIVHLLAALSKQNGRTVLSVTHSLAHLHLYDAILVLHEGRVVFHGPPSQLNHYFSVTDSEEIYPRLATQPSEKWKESWEKHGAGYQGILEKKTVPKLAADAPAVTEQKPAQLKLPGFFTQFFTLLSRRWKMFFRERGQVLLQLAIIICFPLLVILFSDKASANIRKYSNTRGNDMAALVQEEQSVRGDQAKVGSAISGIIMFQVVLLSLMGSNNSAREIAGERLVYEKEKFGGLRPSAYIASKIAFLACLVMAQSLWMAFFVNLFSSFRGDFLQHASFLLLVNAAMTAVCLAISSLMRTAEQSSLLCIYLVGFQLPLSGAVLALPEKVEAFTRPFISAYWGWSGSVESLVVPARDAVKSVIDTSLSLTSACVFVLAGHILVGLVIALTGARRSQWES